jgi:PAS domain S-box-containing protein
MTKMGGDLREKAESMLSKSGTDVARLSTDAVQTLLYEFQVYQIELELQNEELKNAQQELMVSHDRYARLYNSSPIGYLTLSESGVILEANPAAARLLGFGGEELVNKKLGQFIHLSDQDNYYFFLQDILIKRTEQTFITRLNSTCEAAYIDYQGIKYCGCAPEDCIYNDNFIFVECRGSCHAEENEGMQISLSILNITHARKSHEMIACLNEKLEQKVFQQTRALTEANHDLVNKVEQLNFYKQQLIERETKLNSIFNAAVEGIISVDLSGTIVSVNNAVETIFGYSKDELINCNINKLIPLEQRKNHAQHLGNAASHGLSGVVGKIREVIGMRKDGSPVPLDISIAQFSLDGINYLTSIVRDASLRKLQEQRDQDHLDALAHVTRLGLMGEMASGIAHEVNQPLAAITTYSQACLNLIHNGNCDQARIADILLKTNQQALKAGQIIHRMRDFVKPNTIHRSTININDLVNDAVGLCESYLKQNGITLHLQLKKNLSVLFVDSIQIEQVILNLIKNGIESLTNLPPSIPRNLSIQTAMSRDIEVRIKDNGPGISAGEQKKILTPFYTTKPDGMGMGLSICRSIIEAHEGILRFNSQPDKGTTFYFTLPVRRQANGS